MSVNVYIWSSVKTLKAQCLLGEAVGYVLECQTKKGPATRTCTLLFGDKAVMTANGAELYALRMALSRINIKSVLDIYTENPYVANAAKNGWPERWRKNEWKTRAGKEVANRAEWEQLLPMMEGNIISWHVKEDHEYREWLKREVEKERRFVAPVQPVGREKDV